MGRLNTALQSHSKCKQSRILKTMKPYVIFHRTWWKKNPSWPGGREPGVGRATIIARANTEEEAIEMCKAWNASNDPGNLSRKAEFKIGDI